MLLGGPAAALALLLATAGGGRASDDDVAAAQAMQADGLGLLKRGEAAAALRLFQRAYELVPSPKILFNMGRAHVALHDPVEAWQCFDAFLEQATDVPPASRTEALTQRDALRRQIGFLDLAAAEGSEAVVDGRRLGARALGRPVPVMPGGHLVRLQSEGRVISEQTVVIHAGETFRVVTVAARHEPSPPSPSPPLPSPPPAPPPSAPGHGLAWAAAVGGAAALAVGAVFQVRAASRYAQFNDLRDGVGPLCSQSVRNDGLDPRCGGWLQDGRTAQRWAIVGFAAGGVLAAVSATMFYLSRSSEEGGLQAACLPNGPGLGCRWRF